VILQPTLKNPYTIFIRKSVNFLLIKDGLLLVVKVAEIVSNFSTKSVYLIFSTTKYKIQKQKEKVIYEP
jgi:hypothetical protein